MPNTPAAIGKGVTALVANAAVTPAQRALCGELLAAVGSVAWLDDDRAPHGRRHRDLRQRARVRVPARGVSRGRAALDLGLAPALARELALATVAGAAARGTRGRVPPGEPPQAVTSPNGTTQAALDVLMAERGGPAELLKRATEAAAPQPRAFLGA
jgi:pyrroline-5-carboxylate reductase